MSAEFAAGIGRALTIMQDYGHPSDMSEEARVAWFRGYNRVLAAWEIAKCDRCNESGDLLFERDAKDRLIRCDHAVVVS